MPLARTNKRLQDVKLAAPMNESKGIPRATNANQFYQKTAFIVHMDRINKIKAFPRSSKRLSDNLFNVLQNFQRLLTIMLPTRYSLAIHRSAG